MSDKKQAKKLFFACFLLRVVFLIEISYNYKNEYIHRFVYNIIGQGFAVYSGFSGYVL